ncbi:MAG: glycosyltransferase [Paludibacteraceae bacterium]|nr:glycosyltransferase [Paludibacteraceae bacterium]
MNVIIITDALTAPLFTPRVRFLNRQLLAEGHNVTWFAERYQDIPSDIRPGNLVEIPYYSGHKADRLFKGVLSFLFDHKNRFFAHKILRHSIERSITPDIVFVSTFHIFGLRAGFAVARRYHCPLHIDLRDIAEQTPTNAYSRPFLSNNALYRKISIGRRNDILRRAASVSTVSKFQKETVSRVNPNTHVIYNGYDSTIFYPSRKAINQRPITILYVGRWYGERMQDPHPLFRAISGRMDVRLVFYTGVEVHGRLRKLADNYNVNLELHPYVPNPQIPELLRNADIALVLTSPENRGVLTTKFFEALGTRTPVLCTPSDNGELAELIRITHAGIASSDPVEILGFIDGTIRGGGAGLFSAGFDVTVFSRQYQTSRLINLLKCFQS